jgi:activator of HSP90 ATPase
MNHQSSTRRQMLAGVAAGLTALAIAPRILAQTPPAAAGTGKAQDPRTFLHQDVDLPASPARVYAALLDSSQFAAATGAPAAIGREAGSAFSLFGSVIVGRTIELIPDRRIVQAWRPAYWPPGVYSLVHFELAAKGAQTALALDHTGFPEGDWAGLDSGWGLRYWEPFKKYFA